MPKPDNALIAHVTPHALANIIKRVNDESGDVKQIHIATHSQNQQSQLKNWLC